MTTPRRRATYDDLCAVPDHLVAELIEGELYVTPRPASPHALAASVIGGDLVSLFNRPPGEGRWIVASTHGGPELVRAEPFAAVELEPGRWWIET